MGGRKKRTVDSGCGYYTGEDLADARACIEVLEVQLEEVQMQAAHEELERMAAEERFELAQRREDVLRHQLAAERTRARTQLYLTQMGTVNENIALGALKHVALLTTSVKSIFELVNKAETIVLLVCPACGVAWAQDRDEGSPASGWRLCSSCLHTVPDKWEQGASSVRQKELERQRDGVRDA